MQQTLLGLPEIVVEGDGTEIRLLVSDTGNVSSDNFSTKVSALLIKHFI